MPDPFEQFSLAGRAAVVTGATEGIGQGLALALARAGADILVASRRVEKLRETRAAIQEFGRRAELCGLDVASVDSIRELRDCAKEHFGRVDILVNSAAFAVTRPAWEVTEEEWDLQTDTSLKGLFFSCQIIGSLMRAQGYGKIINLSSTFSRSVVFGRSVYCAIKAGVSHLTEALATEWAQEGIRVNALAPTATLTPSRARVLKGEALANVVSRIPLGRTATMDDLAGAAVYLASAASDFVTGQTLFVDGGWIAAS